MLGRALCAFALAAGVLAAPAGAAPLTNYAVPTGGFQVALPATWVDLTRAAPSVLQRLEKVPAFRAFAQAASQDGALKLIAADPHLGGTVYMDTGVERIGPVPLKTVAAATESAIKKTLDGKGTVTATKVQLPAGPAYHLHVVGRAPGPLNQTDEYLLIRDQVEYVLVYVAPSASWKTYSPMFTASAKSFGFLTGPNLSRLVLSGSQIGHGYKVAPFPGGNSFIGETTLDLCDGTYPSEMLRTGRLQVSYTHPKKTVDISNEVVTYVSGGAQQALTEVSNVAHSCSRKAVTRVGNGITTVFRTAPLTDPKLPQGAVVVKLVIRQSEGAKHATSTGIAIYQVKGDTLSGVYTFVAKGTTFADAEKVAFHAAEQSAHNLGLKAGAAAPSGHGPSKSGGSSHGGGKGFVA
jgi:hypothetical protein